jgi:3-phenylpropionate/cinnamic acid dioxygenase small subunit
MGWSQFYFSFRRTIDTRLWHQWQEVIQIACGLHLVDEEDAMI